MSEGTTCPVSARGLQMQAQASGCQITCWIHNESALPLHALRFRLLPPGGKTTQLRISNLASERSGDFLLAALLPDPIAEEGTPQLVVEQAVFEGGLMWSAEGLPALETPAVVARREPRVRRGEGRSRSRQQAPVLVTPVEPEETPVATSEPLTAPTRTRRKRAHSAPSAAPKAIIPRRPAIGPFDPGGDLPPEPAQSDSIYRADFPQDLPDAPKETTKQDKVAHPATIPDDSAPDQNRNPRPKLSKGERRFRLFESKRKKMRRAMWLRRGAAVAAVIGGLSIWIFL